MDEFNQKLISLLPRLRRFALSLTKTSDAADDLVQTTYQKAIGAKERFVQSPDKDQNIDAWMFKIMRNAWLDELRSRKLTTDIDQPDLQLIDHTSTGKAEHQIMLQQTLDAIAGLPDDQREVIALVCIDGLSYKEAADITNTPIGTIMSRLARARKKLAKDMGINI